MDFFCFEQRSGINEQPKQTWLHHEQDFDRTKMGMGESESKDVVPLHYIVVYGGEIYRRKKPNFRKLKLCQLP